MNRFRPLACARGSVAAAVLLFVAPAFAQRTVPAWNEAVDLRRSPVTASVRQGAANAILPEIQPGQFVRRLGTTLMLGDRPFRFNGNNTYYLQAEIAYRREAGVTETLDKMAELGMAVTRANAHNDHPPAQDPAVIQTDPGVYREANLVALDRSIDEARKRNIRMVLKLTNNWEAYGGIRRYVGWKLGRTAAASEYPLFYTDGTIRQWFKDYVRTILERRNTVTGNLYKEEPAILAWELGNELRNPAPGTADALVEWMTEMSAFIKSIDSNHLVADGGEGFDDDPNLYPGLSNRYPVSGREGCSYHRMVEIPDIDMVSYHLYAASWGINDTTDVTIWIKRHEEIARAAGKVAYFGEYGRRADNQNPPGCSAAPGRAFDPERARIFETWLKENAVNQGSAGHMAWQLINDARNDCEGFQIYCPQDGATCDLLRRMSALANAVLPVTTSGASYRPQWLAADSFGSVFGAGLPESPRVLIVDSRGDARPVSLTFAGPTQINFLVPPAVALGGAVLRVLRGDEIAQTATLSVVRAEPGLFTADSSGTGIAAAVVTTVRADGMRVTQLAAQGPVDVTAGDVVLSLYGTGWRAGEGVEATVGGRAVPVLFSGAQGEFPGLDQMNVRLSPALAGLGETDVAVTVSGRRGNPVRLAIR